MFPSILIAVLTLLVNQVLPTPLQAPPFGSTTNGVSEIDVPDLRLLESIQNTTAGYNTWFEALPGIWPGATFHNGGANDAVRGNLPPDLIPSVLYAPGNTVFHLYQIVNSTDFIIAFYDSPPNTFGVILDPDILVLMDRDTYKIVTVLDFLMYAYDHEDASPNEMQFTHQALKWAEVEDGVLYVSNAHRTYAESSNGSNGYITAIDIQTNEIIWRSQPLVSNGENFLLLEEIIISGYGFTDEDDFIYILDRSTGEVIASIPVPSSPDYFFYQNSMVSVNCYDAELIFSLN